MSGDRPDPDELLARVQADEARGRRGKLKIFFGYAGVVVRETLADDVLEQADDYELVDLTPEELMERLKGGKVYLPQQAERALGHFFQKTNLVALRELSLRQAAQRLNQDVQAARRET